MTVHLPVMVCSYWPGQRLGTKKKTKPTPGQCLFLHEIMFVPDGHGAKQNVSHLLFISGTRMALREEYFGLI